MFSTSFIRRPATQHPDRCIRLPEQITSSFQSDDHFYEGVHLPQSAAVEECRALYARTNQSAGTLFANGLIASIDRFHRPEAVLSEMLALLSPSDQSHGLAISAKGASLGDGINPPAGTGSHALSSAYLLVDRHDTTQWHALFRYDREIFYQNGRLFYQVSGISYFIKPGFVALDEIHRLAGAMIGGLMAFELEQVAFLSNPCCKAKQVSLVFAEGIDDADHDSGFLFGVKAALRNTIETINEEPEFFSAGSFIDLAAA